MSFDLLKKRNLGTVCSEVFALFISAFILAASFPGFLFSHGIGVLSLIALIPLFMVIRNTTWPLVAPYGFFYGFVFYLLFNYWLKSFHPLAILIVPIIKGGEMLLLFPALKASMSLLKKKSYILEAVIWVAYAYLSQSWFAGYPYGTIAYALYGYDVLIQIADITGIWGIIFMMVFPQSFIATYLLSYMKGEKEGLKAIARKNIIPLSIYALLLILTLTYGIIKNAEWDNKEADKTIRIAAVQHNHDSWQGGITTYRRNFNNLKRYTLESLSENPDMVIWSETAFVPSIEWNQLYDYEGNHENRVLTLEFLDFAKSLSVPLLTGNADGEPIYPDQGPVLEDGSQNRKDYNAVVLFDDNQIVQKYRKQHLVPFTEHFPYEKQLPWLYNLLLANDYNWWEKGDESVVFSACGVNFSTPICFEDVFGYLNAEFVDAGADLIINMTNDNWSKSEIAARQHANIAAFRSIETRKTMLRGTNSGLTCLITPAGDITEEMSMFTMGYHIYTVPVYESEADTFYVEHIDLFARIAVWASAITLVSAFMYRVLVKVKVIKKK